MSIAFEFTGILKRGKSYYEISEDFSVGLEGHGLGGEYIGLGRVNGSILASAEEITEDEDGKDVIYTSDNVARVDFTAIDLSVTGCDILANKAENFETENLEGTISCVVEPILYYYPIFEKAYNKAMDVYSKAEEISDAQCYILSNKCKPYLIILNNIEVEENWRESGVCTFILENLFKIIKEHCMIESLMVFGVYEDSTYPMMGAENVEAFAHCLEKTDFELFEYEDKKCFAKFIYDVEHVENY